MTYKNIVVLGGYSRSGKTTALRQLERLGYTVFASSDIVHSHTQNFIKLLSGELVDTYRKSTEYQLISSNSLSAMFNQRDLLIALAESTRLLEPNFYARLITDKVNASKATNIAFETVGGTEWEFIQTRLTVKPSGTYNVRRPGVELSGVDIRKLLPDAATIWNSGKADEYKALIERIFDLEQDYSK